MSVVTIKDVQVIMTQPLTSRLIVVKVITSEPGLYGLGCATFTQRFHAVRTALEQHLKPLLIGRDVSRIEDLFQTMMVNSYWRNGPVLNNAISGVDIALWDIKGKMANMPVYELLGGKSREAAAVYVHANAETIPQVIEAAQGLIAEGYRHIRMQMGGYGGKHQQMHRPDGALDGAYYDPRAYVRNMLAMLTTARAELGDNIELLHDIHERLHPVDAMAFAKAVEPLNLFFLEDALAPEDLDWFERIRQHTTTRLAMGELFVHPVEWRVLVERRLIDFIRMHISAIGGLTPARNAAILAGAFGIRTAWHGPPDVSPVGHAANVHLDVWAPNFGIQEWCRFPELVYEIFPGTPEVRDGYMYPNDKPGLGIDIDEKLAAKFPCTDEIITWTQTRLPDGTAVRP
ncbi:MAG: starvation-sensing protein RspA [Chloroflexi bacterium]|nr:starvation-sensing protein RspA [Chloroflexota bacterium]